jgi:hypothetical protein
LIGVRRTSWPTSTKWIRYPAPASVDDRKLAEALEFVNGNLGVAAEARAEILEHETQERKTVQGPDGEEMYVAFRSVGRFYFNPNFHRYPFDRQKLPIVIEHEVLTAEELELVDDEESYQRAGGPKEHWASLRRSASRIWRSSEPRGHSRRRSTERTSATR